MKEIDDPRRSGKRPWPAPVYLTDDMFNRREGRHLSWGFDLGLVEELIKNFGFLGILGGLLIGGGRAERGARKRCERQRYSAKSTGVGCS